VYEIEWSDEAEADFNALPVFVRGPLVAAIAALRHQAETETRSRKPLREPPALLTEAEWSVRVDDFRVLYRVERPAVRILRVILKGTSTLDEALGRSVKR
jgi:mRNA-degrading endonuclease RelE of RelBE toxin-antitoxin system